MSVFFSVLAQQGGSAPPPVTNPSVVSVSAMQSGFGDVTAVMPTGLASGDLLIAFCERNKSDDSPVPAADWAWSTAIDLQHGGSSSDRSRMFIFFHEYLGTDPDLLFLDQGGNHLGVKIVAVRDVGTVRTIASSISTGNVTTHVLTGGSTVDDDSIVLAVASIGENPAVSAVDVANLTLTGPADQAEGHASGNDGAIVYDYATLATAGATGNFTFSTNVTARSCMILLELAT